MKYSIKKTVYILVLVLTLIFTIKISGTLDSDEENETFTLVIDYYSNWNATIMNHDEIFLEGMGRKEYLFVWPQESEANVTITAYKLDNSYNPLTIHIRKFDGTSLGQASTTTPNGIAFLKVKLN